MRIVRFTFAFGLMFVCMMASAADPTISVTAQQRYPWNGFVDLSFTITGDSGMKFDTSFVAKDLVGGTNFLMKTVYKSNGSSAALTNSLAAGSYKWVWNAAADLPSEFICERVKVVGDIVSEAYKKRYMVVTLSNGSIQYLREPPAGGWTDNPYKQTKWVFKRIEAGSFAQASGSSSSRQVTISKPFYIAITPFTSYHGRTIGSEYSIDHVTTPSDVYDYKWPSVTTTVLMGDWPGGGNHTTLLDFLQGDTYGDTDTTVTKLNKKTKKTFKVPTEAQLTLARKAMNIGSSWLFTRDYWHSDLGSAAVTDPCSIKSGGTYVGQYIPMTCVTQSSRSNVYAFENGQGKKVCLRLCCPVD